MRTIHPRPCLRYPSGSSRFSALDSAWKFLGHGRSVSQPRQKGKKQASPSDSTSPYRFRCHAVVGKQFHPDGRQHQVDLERSRGDRRGAVATQRILVVTLPLPSAHWLANAAKARHMRSVAGVRSHVNGGKMMKSLRVIGTSALFLLLGWTVPADSHQDQQDKPK